MKIIIFLSEYHISDYQKMVLKVWNEFIKIIGPKTIGFPIWSDEFYSEYNLNDLPDWKRVFVEKNRNLYKAHKFEIDQWYKKYRVNELVKTHRKFEWQAGNHISSIYEGIIQFRPSGVRVKKPDDSPTLVAMAHIPILGKYQRYIAPNEAVKLQSFPESFKFETVGNDIYRMLGNAVNVDVIYTVTKQFIEYIEKQLGGGFNEKKLKKVLLLIQVFNLISKGRICRWNQFFREFIDNSYDSYNNPSNREKIE